MMRRTPMKPGKGFKSRAPAAQDRDPDRVRSVPTLTPGKWRQSAPIEGHVAPIEKDAPARSDHYLRLVAMFPCAMCGRHGPSQAAHANTGKAMAMKADDRTAFPLCADRPGERGCHSMLDQGGAMGRQERRELELRLGRETRDKVRAMNLWPRTLPPWEELPK